MPKKAKVKFRSLRTNLVHLPLSLYASLTQQQTVSAWYQRVETVWVLMS